MRSEYEIKDRLAGLRARYRMVSSDTIDPETEAQIKMLKWVLNNEKYISHDG